MQFGLFTVSDITTDPTTGKTPTEHERIQAWDAMARKAEEVGLDVFAIGEHHNPPFFSSSPTTALAHLAAKYPKLLYSTSTTLITTNDPVKIAEDYAMLQHLTDGNIDLMMGRGNTGRCTRGSVKISVRVFRWLLRTTTYCAGYGAKTW